MSQQTAIDTQQLLEKATSVLNKNDKGNYTCPSVDIYPHQWLWDSCFIAIGLRHLDIERAKTEILSLLDGQWHNGMIPNLIFADSSNAFQQDRLIWQSSLNPNSPESKSTSGITQPPLISEAVVRIGEKLPLSERRSWYKQTYPKILAYHKWLYDERDPHGEGLVLQIHPWETGLDNTPPWMKELHEHQLPWWVHVIKKIHAEPIINLFRRDTHQIPSDQRMNPVDALALYAIQSRLRRKNYNISKILSHSLFSIEDVTFNSILIRANQHLQKIAKTIHQEIPDNLLQSMHKSKKSLENLWDQDSSNYYSRNFANHELIKEPSIGTLLPLYSGCITQERANSLVKLIEDENAFGTTYPLPSVPADSNWFSEKCYWQGPTWINANWLIIDGLRLYGFADHADSLTESTLEMVARSGFAEYFNPFSGLPYGAKDFSWTAALTIDLSQAPK